MPLSLFPPVDFSLASDGLNTNITLPPPLPAKGRAVGCFVLVFGFVCIGAAIFWFTVGHLSNHQPPVLGRPNPSPIPDYFFAVWGLFSLLIGLALAGAALGLLFPRPITLTVSPSTLRVRCPFGPFLHTKELPLASIASITTVASAATSVSLPLPTLTATTTDGRAIPLVRGHHPDTLARLTQTLAEEMARRGTRIATPDPPRPVNPPPDTALYPADAPAPPNTKIQSVITADAATFLIPRSGFRGPAGFFLFFSLFWNGIAWTVFITFLVGFLHSKNLFDLLPVLFLALFVAIGLFTAGVAVHLARRTTVLLATAESLTITQKSPLRNTERQFPRADLAAIRDDRSNTEINNQPLRELRIYTADGDKKSFLDGGDPAELAWIAATLRTFYTLPTDLPT